MPADGLRRLNLVVPNPLPEDVCYGLEKIGSWTAEDLPRVVTTTSALRARCAVETFAWYFKWQFGYDFVQYRADEDTHQKDFCLLWTDIDRTPTGAACFRWRSWQNRADAYGLAWIWMHPFQRGAAMFSLSNKSLVATAWPSIRERVPELAIEPPISKAMLSFLTRQGEEFETERSIFLKPFTKAASNGTICSAVVNQ